MANRKNTSITSVVKVKINEDNEIEYMEENENEDSDENDADGSGNSTSDENVKQIDEDSVLVQRSNGVMTIKSKNHTVVEHVCGKCSKSYDTITALKRHLNLCRNVPKNEAVSYQERDNSELLELSDKFTEGTKDKKTCFCCMENLITAHSGHIQCNFCPKSFKSHLNLERHLFTLHSASTKYPCTSCNATCPSQEILNLHVKSHQQTSKPFSCKNCGKDFTRKYHLDRHHQYTGCGNRPKVQLPCEVCDRVFTRYDNLREHLRGHMGQVTRKRDYKCPYCDKAFYGSSLLNIHLRTHTGERPFPCDLCEKAFPSNGALRKHRRMHTGERPYCCEECKKCFSARETLNRHMKIHTGERPHVCKICNKSYIQGAQLKTHMFYHTGQNGFSCDYCHHVFSRKKRLETHLTTMHKTISGSIKKEFVCDKCHETFNTKATLLRHLQTHQMQYCPICKQEFIRFDALESHVLKIHGTTFEDAQENKTLVMKNKPATIIRKQISENVIESYIVEVKQRNKTDGPHTIEIISNHCNVMNINELRDNISQLLKTLMDEDMLMEFGWPNALVDDVLESVIKQCDHKPVNKYTCPDVATILRENTKILFTSVIDNDSIKKMLNNFTIDEVIMQVLKLPS